MNRPFLFLTFLILLFIALNFQSFIDNLWFYASGNVLGLTIKNNWWFVLLNIGLFLSLIFFAGRKVVDWKAHGVFSAFIISLFIEMYGIPLSIYFLASKVATPETQQAVVSHAGVFSMSIFEVNLLFDFWMTFGAIVIVLGMAIIVAGWHQLWSSKKNLYTDGLYKISRHPQYIGFLYVVWGWMIAWPTLITLLMAPALTYAYANAAKKEEEHILKQNSEYAEYRKKTPFMI